MFYCPGTREIIETKKKTQKRPPPKNLNLKVVVTSCRIYETPDQMNFINSVFYKRNTSIPEMGITAKQLDYIVF